MRVGFRRFLFQAHLYTGLTAAVFLALAGITGSILAFEDDYDHWFHPSLWRVRPQSARLSEQQIVDRGEALLRAQGSAHVEQIELGDWRTAQVLLLTDRSRIFVNPYTGAILGTREGLSKVELVVGYIHQLHVRLLAGNTGEWIVDIATMLVLFLIPTGLYLWWDKKRLKVKLSRSMRRITWDVHNVLGVYGCLFLIALAITGLLLAFETPLYWMVRSDPWRQAAMPRSASPQSGASVPAVDEFMSAADRALPGAQIYEIHLPQRARSPVQILKRGPGMAGHSTVFLDRYTAGVLRVDDLSKLPRSYRAHLIDEAIHRATILGMPSKFLFSFASLVLAALAVTGCMMWWPKARSS